MAAALTASDILRRIRWDPLTQKGSVLDTVQLVTSCGQGNATKVYQRLLDQHPFILPKCQNLKFEGKGQRPTPVASTATLVEIAWLCPGRAAKEFRRQGAVTLCRALGGDLSLVEEIKARHAEIDAEDQEALLSGTGVSAAEANGQSLVAVPTEEQVRRYKAETLKIEADARQVALDVYSRMLSQADAEADERDRLFFQDAARNFIRCQYEVPGYALLEGVDPAGEQVTISEVARDMGVRLQRGEESCVGRMAAALYRDRHGESPPKHKRFVDGAVRAINLYFAKDRDLLERAIDAVVTSPSQG
jgi:hypothetical protein